MEASGSIRGSGLPLVLDVVRVRSRRTVQGLRPEEVLFVSQRLPVHRQASTPDLVTARMGVAKSGVTPREATMDPERV
jgi:hypothetical protein